MGSVGSDTITSSLPHNWPIFARAQRNIRAPFVLGVCVLNDVSSSSRQTDTRPPLGQHCEFGDNCCMGHVCPRGLNCTFLRQGRCKYSRRKSVRFQSPRPRSLTCPSIRTAEMHILIPNAKGRGKRVQKQSADGMSEMAFSESGFSQ